MVVTRVPFWVSVHSVEYVVKLVGPPVELALDVTDPEEDPPVGPAITDEVEFLPLV